MKAAYYCGDRTVEIGECRIQSPSAGQVRLEVAYCGVCGTDIHIYLGHQDCRIDMPQVIGHEMSGRIAEVGADVEGWAVGDSVVVRPLEACGACAACNAGNGHICQNLNFIGIDSPGGLSGVVDGASPHTAPPARRYVHDAGSFSRAISGRLP